MSIYKVTTQRILFVDAENKEEAEELALDDCAIMSDESIVSVKKSTKSEMHTVMLDGIKGGVE